MTSPYTAMIPDMTTGIRLLTVNQRLRDFDTFMMRSDRKVPTPAILIPAFAVPYAAPMARVSSDIQEFAKHEKIIYTTVNHFDVEEGSYCSSDTAKSDKRSLHISNLVRAKNTPYIGHFSEKDMTFQSLSLLNSQACSLSMRRLAVLKLCVLLGLGQTQ